MQKWSTRKYCIRDPDEICTTRFKNRFDKCRNGFFVLKYAQFYLDSNIYYFASSWTNLFYKFTSKIRLSSKYEFDIMMVIEFI